MQSSDAIPSKQIAEVKLLRRSILELVLFLIYVNEMPYNNGSLKYTLCRQDNYFNKLKQCRLSKRAIKQCTFNSKKKLFNNNKLVYNKNKTGIMTFRLRKYNTDSSENKSVKLLGA